MLAAILLATLLLGACGDGAVPTTTTTPPTTAAPECGYYDTVACGLYGLVLPAALPTADALAAVAALPGVPIALWRTDFVCVLETSMGPPGQQVPTSPSRFAYVDAEGIRERRLATSGSVAPPITGLHISASYWNRLEDQWSRAREEGTLVEAVAVWLPDAFAAAGAPEEFAAIVPVPWRRTDTLDPAVYSGELLLESEGNFPEGYLSEPAPITCN